MREAIMRVGPFLRLTFAVAAVGFFALVLSGCGGGKKSAAPDSNASLSSLVLSAGTLAPAFSAETISYSAEVAFAESSVTVTPTAEDGKATIKVNGETVQSGTASQSISLTVGSNAMDVVVTAEDGTTTRTYTVSVKRQEVDAGTWVEISSGTFTMGSPQADIDAGFASSDEVQHQVTLTHGFVMLSTEVTQAEFQKRMGYNPSDFSTCGTNCPVETVDWHEAAAYCNALSTAAGRENCYTCTGTGVNVICTPSTSYGTPYACLGYRLPTEAEWEYAARAGTTTATYNGDLVVGQLADEQPNVVLDPIAWFYGNSPTTDFPDGTTHAVGVLKANNWGLYDMLGNVSEWCQDWYGDYPTGTVDPPGPSTGWNRVFRGGSWDYYAGYARAAYRYGYDPGFRYYHLGFRPVRSLP